ncbi:ABC transporter substrate-binding protein [Alkalilimnicola ehrlichii]|uniref:ABC transporter substrate-binding protein n=1 Tax=Alkalilimnicola ehrlichii TaxID=351052 RepID=A0A3E0WGY2_9GAMM|nr:TRAP transporter substrate-binding protein DctP [Alkalilimnicola ehrlichii]RFA24489.1 ABC transporter substrate-binding protein [Alkalilimnicola ehrlichii]RFA32154.1 ABC transporter substrate-binding protein [Alkalilimnicola ehrlichii]
MKRRDFLTATGAAVTTAAAGFAPAAIASKRRYRFEMVTSWPRTLKHLFGGAEFFAQRLNQITDGAVELTVHPAGAEVGAMEVYDAVSSGAFEFGHTAPYYYIGRSPAHGFFTAMPFGLTVSEQMAWMVSGNGQRLWDELNAADDLIAFPVGNTGPQTGGWFNKEINEPKDLRGLRMRFPGHGGRVMARAGVNIQQLPGGEVYMAMERGTLDAAEWVGPHDDEILNMHRVAKYYYLPSWAEPSAMLGVYINRSIYSDLPGWIQHAIQAAAAEADRKMLADYMSDNPAALKRLIDHGVEVRTFSQEVLEVFEKGTQEVHTQDMRDRQYARIYEDWAAFRDKVRSWSGISDQLYQAFLYRDR